MVAVASLADAEARLRRAISGLGLGSDAAVDEHRDAWTEYKESCAAHHVCGNLGCAHPVPYRWCRFCDEHCSEPRHIPHYRVCDASFPEDNRSCQGEVDAVIVVNAEGTYRKGCVLHAAYLLPLLYGATVVTGTVPGAVHETYWLAGLPMPEHAD